MLTRFLALSMASISVKIAAPTPPASVKWTDDTLNRALLRAVGSTTEPAVQPTANAFFDLYQLCSFRPVGLSGLTHSCSVAHRPRSASMPASVASVRSRSAPGRG